MRNVKKFSFVILSIIFFMVMQKLYCESITIEPTKIQQRSDWSNYIDIYYDLPAGDYVIKNIEVYYSFNMKKYFKAKGVKGKFDVQVPPKNIKIIWNISKDIKKTVMGKIDIKLKCEKLITRPIIIPDGLIYYGKNDKGFYEYKNKKDGSILVYIPAGSFSMGSNSGSDDEKPVHSVYLDGYFISKYEITFDQYDRFCKKTIRWKLDDEGWGRGKYPVINVWWDGAVTYCKWVGLSLPTEAQWEKASRGGENYKYSGSDDLNSVGWYYKNSGRKTHPVGEKKANGYGLFDMSGNVEDWCADWYGKRYYKSSPKNNPKGPSSGKCRVHRGGCWISGAFDCRCARRDYYVPLYSQFIGFRPVKNLK